VDPASPAELRAALERLIVDRDLREDMARRASARSRRYTAERMACQYRRLYARLLEAGRVPA
jgi:glycosyltransferase involved in cell wall biosynthesis